MITIAVVTLIVLVGALFAAMAVAPVLIEAGTHEPRSHGNLVLLETPPRPAGDLDQPTAA